MEEEELVPVPACPNCGHKLNKGDRYCAACGQRVQARRVPLWDLFYELGEAFFNVDNKIFLTLKALVFPGRLSVLFFSGKRKRFVHPARLFLVTAIVFLAVLNYTALRQVRAQFEGGEDDIGMQVFRKNFRQKIFVAYDSLKALRPQDRGWQMGLDTMMQVVGRPQRDSLTLGYFTYLPREGIVYRNLRMDNQDLLGLPPDTLVERYRVEGYLGKTIVMQTARVTRNPAGFWQFAIGQVTWMLLLMMPAIALLMKLLYIRRNRFFIEHLYFNFHTHAFIFLLFSLTLFLPVTDAVRLPIAFGVGAIYVYLAMLRFYGQGWFKTLLKYFLIGFAYINVIVIFMSLTFLISGIFYS